MQGGERLMKHLYIVAGGTGGHIFPAIAFGEWLKTHRREVSVSFVCGSRTLELEIYEASGIKPIVLPISGSPFGIPSLSGKAKRVRDFFTTFSIFKAILKERPVDACVLFGGYVSFVPLLLCHRARIPTVAHEQNSVAGKVTRLSSTLGKRVASGWNMCSPLSHEKFSYTGIPVRRFELKTPLEAWNSLGLGKTLPVKKIVGVLGGSLMSQRLIQLLCPLLHAPGLEEVAFIIIGVSQLPDAFRHLQDTRRNIFFIEKQWDMSNFFSVVDAVVTRGGASTLAELAALGIPALIIPWRKAADNHQESNARCFLEHNEGALWQEEEPPEILKECILRILRSTRRPERAFSEGDESESILRLISSSSGREII